VSTKYLLAKAQFQEGDEFLPNFRKLLICKQGFKSCRDRLVFLTSVHGPVQFESLRSTGICWHLVYTRFTREQRVVLFGCTVGFGGY
jgi:hypothetical protein